MQVAPRQILGNILSKFLMSMDLSMLERNLVAHRATEVLNKMTDAEADRWLKDAAAELKKYGY